MVGFVFESKARPSLAIKSKEVECTLHIMSFIMKLDIILNESRESTDDLPTSSLLRLPAAPDAGSSSAPASVLPVCVHCWPELKVN